MADSGEQVRQPGLEAFLTGHARTGGSEPAWKLGAFVAASGLFQDGEDTAPQPGKVKCAGPPVERLKGALELPGS